MVKVEIYFFGTILPLTLRMEPEEHTEFRKHILDALREGNPFVEFTDEDGKQELWIVPNIARIVSIPARREEDIA